ncbi:hypothetical protein TYRP_019808 [Tyrophagus putrescentiae]|nr:hypothetical protein TYRP_019808 [Tyrophagus putrescentiae]
MKREEEAEKEVFVRKSNKETARKIYNLIHRHRSSTQLAHSLTRSDWLKTVVETSVSGSGSISRSQTGHRLSAEEAALRSHRLLQRVAEALEEKAQNFDHLVRLLLEDHRAVGQLDPGAVRRV